MKTISALAGLSALAASTALASPFPEAFDRRYADVGGAPSFTGGRGGGAPNLAARQQEEQTAPAPPANLPNATRLSYAVPAPLANGGKAWKEAHGRARSLVGQMTVEEKVSIVTGQVGRCAGNTGSIERLGLPTICHQDGPAGVRPATGKTQFPSGHTAAATWDRDLIYKRALAMGQEFYDLGIHVALSPVTGGPLGRSPYEGRNWEGFAADPYATGVGAYYSVKGLQDAGVTATSKHFIAYEQETYRNLYGQTASYSVFPASAQLPIDSYVDSKTTHELYAWPFAEAVRAGTGYVMSSYNMVNGTHASANSELLNGLLKTEFNFQGPVISDWGGVWSTQYTIIGGNDLDMPGLGYGGSLGVFYDTELVSLVQNGTVPESRLNDAVTRVLTPYFAHGQADKPLPPTVINAVDVPGLPIIYKNVQKDSTLELIKKIGQDGAVLLKNVDGALPLKKAQSIAIIGQTAGPAIHSDYECGAFGDGCPNNSNNGTFSLGFGSGYSQPQNLISPLSSIQERALQDRSLVRYALNNSNMEDIEQTAAKADVALVFVEAYAAEGQDRETLLLTADGDAIVQAAASQNNNTIVVMYIPGSVVIDAWIEHPNVTAVIAPLFPGEQAGPALVPLLYGNVSPSGKLPFTISKKVDDFLPNSIVKDEVVAPKSYFEEGLNIDYRWFDSKDITPRYEFGFGLSYSSFGYSNIQLKSAYEADKYAIQETHEKYRGQKDGESLYDQIMVITADVKNKGDVTACEVAQLYIQFPESEDQPPRQLRGFDKIKQLKAGSSETASFSIRRKDVMVWDTVMQKWRMPKDGYVVFHVGSSSRKLPLSVKHEF